MNETTLSDLIARLTAIRDATPGAGSLRVVFSLAHLDVESVTVERPDGHDAFVVVVA